jgi:hypothetical protein
MSSISILGLAGVATAILAPWRWHVSRRAQLERARLVKARLTHPQWPQPADPRPGDAEKDQLENDLHRLVCGGKLSLTDAQKCISSNWVECWEKYVVPEYGPEWAAANRHGW